MKVADMDKSDGTKICKCHKKKCKECSEESLKYNLCISCNEEEGYYAIFNDKNNKSGFIDCYKAPEGYYFDNEEKKYNPCYPSCKYCYNKSEDKYHHLCSSCNEENSYSILEENNPNNMSCYPECKYNYYFDKHDDYKCITTPGCPTNYSFLLENTKQCIEECEKNSSIFRQTCFKKYPNESKNCTKVGDFHYCDAKCPFERPFEIADSQFCVSNCTIMERYNKLCFTNYDGDRNKEVQDMVLSDFKVDIGNAFDFTNITENHSIIHEEKKLFMK
jgi:hypothetical protein